MQWTDEAIAWRMKKGWSGAKKEGTPCGTGSLRVHTENIRRWLPGIFQHYEIKTICDAGAGDVCWQQSVLTRSMVYRAFDLVPRRTSVTKLDITKEALPHCDAIICRLVLIHLDPERIMAALDLFKQSARYLLATQYQHAAVFNPLWDCNHTDLRPILGSPLCSVQDSEDPDCSLALWDLKCKPML